MSWGRRKPDGDIGAISKPQPVNIAEESQLARESADLQEMQRAVSEAQAAQLPGNANSVVDTVDIAAYEPSVMALDEALRN